MWKAIPGYEGAYEASDFGEIRSLIAPSSNGRVLRKTPKLLSQRSPRHDGYKTVALYDEDGKSKTHFVHSLVALTFIGPRPFSMECCHVNGNCGDNAATNLYWGTPQSNQQDRLKHGTDTRGTKHPNAKLSDPLALEVKRRAIAGEQIKALAAEYGVSSSLICALKFGKARHWLEV